MKPGGFGTCSRAWPLACAFIVAACGSGGGGGDGLSNRPQDDVPPGDATTAECSVVAQNRWVDTAMRDYYLFFDQVPPFDPDTADSPEAVLEALRVNPPDRFSFIQPRSQNQLLDEGIAFGFGFMLALDGDGIVGVVNVDDGSPADDAGLARGQILETVNDQPIASLSDAAIGDAFSSGTAEDPNTLELGIRRDGATVELVLTSAAYDYDGVGEPDVFENETTGTRVGYLVVDGFTDTTPAALDAVFAAFETAGIDELVVDLRYNPGGLTLPARRLASHLAGEVVFGERFEALRVNARYADDFDGEIAFPAVAASLALPRVVFLTTGATASSAELVINGLAPWTEVATIGARTLGKPYQFLPDDRCDKRLWAVSIESVNAVGASVRDGIAPTCAANDDYRNARGETTEGMLAAALEFITDGSCTPAIAAGSPRERSFAANLTGNRDIPGAIATRQRPRPR